MNRHEQSIALIIVLSALIICGCSGCAYNGPALNFSAGFNGIQFGIGIAGSEPSRALPATKGLAK